MGICSFLAGSAQRAAIKPDQLDTYEIKLQPAINDAKGILPFNSIKIIDARFDTSKVGFATIYEQSFSKLIVKNGLQETAVPFLNEYYTQNFHLTDSRNLVIVVKTLWLHQINISDKAGKKFIDRQSLDDRQVNEVVAKFETYIEQNNYYQALYRIDTAFATDGKFYKVADELLLLPFYLAVNKTMNADLTGFLAQRQKLSLEAVYQYNASRFNLPCFETDKLARGVYMTFHDFINGKPTYENFTIEKGKLSDELYIEQNGNKVLLTDCWGFCDGSDNYIKLGFSLYPFYKQGNTYELWGSHHITHTFNRSNAGARSPAEVLLMGASFNKNRTKNYLRPMQINMETGKAY